MAKLVFGMNQSLDGYVDYTAFAPSPVLFRHFIDQTRSQAGSLYGRRLYEIMAYWDEDHDGWGDDDREFADAWRKAHKWVVSRTLKSVGPNATLLDITDLKASVGELKSKVQGVIDVGGPGLARSLTDLGIIDEYRIYLHPVVLGTGTPFFAAARPPLRLIASERLDDSTITLTYVPA